MALPSPKGIVLMGSGEGYFRQMSCYLNRLRETTVKKPQVLEGTSILTEGRAMSRLNRLVFSMGTLLPGTHASLGHLGRDGTARLDSCTARLKAQRANARLRLLPEMAFAAVSLVDFCAL